MDGKTKAALHKKVRDADEGDIGWVWYEGDWHPARLAEEDDGLFIGVMMETDTYWISVTDGLDPISDAPWMPISRPPYQGDEQPVTHQLSMTDAEMSISLSWTMGLDEGREFTKRIVSFVRSGLDAAKAD